MKKLISTLTLLAGLPAVASAHTLAGDEGVITQLQHELLGGHHLPLTILLVVVGVVAYRGLRARKKT